MIENLILEYKFSSCPFNFYQLTFKRVLKIILRLGIVKTVTVSTGLEIKGNINVMLCEYNIFYRSLLIREYRCNTFDMKIVFVCTERYENDRKLIEGSKLMCGNFLLNLDVP